MASEYQSDEKGKVRPRPPRQPEKEREPGQHRRPLSPDDLRGRPDAGAVQRMQQTVGNAVVQRFLAQRRGAGETEVDEESAAAINRARGSGTRLDAGVAEQAGEVMGTSFDDVTIHADGEADRLSRDLGARAFTTGNDIFFREGAYEPGSSAGQELLAHELTHVVQQGGQAPASASQMTVNDPDDAYESEADAVAQTVVNQSGDGGGIQAQEEAVQMQEEEEAVQMQEEEEELVQMQEEEEEALQLQEEEEEELVQLQEEEEEEELFA